MEFFLGFDFGVFFGYPLPWSFVAISVVVIFGFFGGFGFVWTVPMDSWRRKIFGCSIFVFWGRLASVPVWPSISGISIFDVLSGMFFTRRV